MRDAAASEDFYVKAFGFVRVLHVPDEEGRGSKLVLAHPDSRTILGLSVHQTTDGTSATEFRAGLDHVSFGVASIDELEAWAARLDEAGIERSEIRTSPLGALLTVRDPDNIQVELWADVVPQA